MFKTLESLTYDQFLYITSATVFWFCALELGLIH